MFPRSISRRISPPTTTFHTGFLALLLENGMEFDLNSAAILNFIAPTVRTNEFGRTMATVNIAVHKFAVRRHFDEAELFFVGALGDRFLPGPR